MRAIQLYQALLRFHKNDAAPPLAFANADLERLGWGWNSAFGDNKNPRYKAALEDFIKTYGDFEVSALALHSEARVFQLEEDLVGAHALAARGAQLFPRSPGGKLCRNLVEEIEAKSAAISTERIWTCFEGTGEALPQHPEDKNANNPGICPKITVQYRNIEAVYFRAIRYDWEVFLQKRHNRPENLSDAERRQIVAQAPALEWSEQLPPTADFKENAVSVLAPDKLKPGFYFIVASHNPNFGEKQNVVSLAPVWVTDLSLVTRTHDGLFDGFVLAANSGDPIEGAEISIWHLDQTGNRVADPSIRTDTNGAFAFKPIQSRTYLFRARFNGREVASANDLWSNQGESANLPQAQTIFFTDRAIYRPGQTIQFKGICLWVDRDKDDYQVLKRENLAVVFRDQNGKEIERQSFQANDYGSFSGSFTAPRDRLMGQMSLQVEGRATGLAWVRVEEYKRPKFQVTLDAPKTAARLNEKVTLSGHAMTYAGAPVDGSPLRYRVVRQARMPWWWGWYGRAARTSDSQEIAHGVLTTGIDGSFSLEFQAKPDPKIPETDEPTFVFQINADVTDTAGETRSAGQSIRVGYTALEANLNASEWQTPKDPVSVAVSTRTLDGEPQIAEGRVQIYDLQAPLKPEPAPLDAGWRPRMLSRIRTGGNFQVTTNEDLSNPNNWPLGKVVAESGFTTDTNGSATLSFKLPAGAYRALLETQDRFGKKVTGRLPIQVLDPQADHLAIKIPHLLAAPSWEAQPGNEFSALWGSGYDYGRAFVEIEHRHQMLQRFWTEPGQTQRQIKLAVTEAMRGGFTLHLTQIREDRAYLDSRKIEVPWRNKELDIKWEHFVSKLQPSQKETWTAVISRPDSAGTNNGVDPESKAAEMVATLYDESLDAFAPLAWPQRFGIFREDYSTIQPQFANQVAGFQYAFGNWVSRYVPAEIRYRSFPPELTAVLWRYAYFDSFGGVGGRVAKSAVLGRELHHGGITPLAASAPAAGLAFNAQVMESEIADKNLVSRAVLQVNEPGSTSAPDLGQVTARKNLSETAFFYPQLTADSNGVVRMTFTMPEALTKWHFMGFAHDSSVRSGFFQDHAVTSKDLMVQPNPPRFLREGDMIEFTVKVSNQSDSPQTGTVRLSFDDALTGKPADQLLGMRAAGAGGVGRGGSSPIADQNFDIPAKQSRAYSWRLTIPDGCGFLNYKAVAASAKISDGEEGAIPVLSRRILVRESLPLPIRGPTTKKFEFTRLLKSGSSKSLQNEGLTVQMVSNPAWYAVLALPYLMEYPYECSEQTFNRLYANALARTVAASDPKIHRVFEQWRNTTALDSPLEKNQDLKSVALEETPWLRDAQSESQARRNVGILFDDNRLNSEIQRTLDKLSQMQLSDGSWPWFPGGYANDYITLYITTGFGRLRRLGADVNVAPALRSLTRLDAWMTEEYERIQSHPEPDKYVPSPTDALYLYGRSFFLKDQGIALADQKAVTFFLNQSRKFWLKTDCRQTQGQLAIALARFSAFNRT
ncbi:MAG TPA: alpha-2-macroglobulin family protein, partial [Patescibacteria group bacterium]|nr:alpha-2-macroglobulin family protein [Patescibacteria group bacterium]